MTLIFFKLFFIPAPSSCWQPPISFLSICIYLYWTFHIIEPSMWYVGEGDGTPLQYSCLENPMDGGAWWAKSQTRLSDFPFTFHFNALEKEMATHSSVLAWRIPGMAEPGGLPSMGSHRVGHDWSDLATNVICNLWCPLYSARFDVCLPCSIYLYFILFLKLFWMIFHYMYIPQFVYSFFINIWVVSTFCLLWIVLLWTFIYKDFEYLFSFLLGVYPGVELLWHLLILGLTF